MRHLALTAVMLLVVTLPAADWTQDGSAAVYLVGAANGPAPLVIHLRVAKGSVAQAVATSPWWPLEARTKAPPRSGSSGWYGVLPATTAAVKVAAGRLDFRLKASGIEVTVTSICADGRLTGRWEGSVPSGTTSGTLIGTAWPGSGIAEGATLVLGEMDPEGSDWDGRNDLLISLVNRGGAPVDGRVIPSPTGSIYFQDYNREAVFPLVGLDGERLHITKSHPLRPILGSLTGTIRGDGADLALTCTQDTHNVKGKSVKGHSQKITVKTCGRLVYGDMSSDAGKEAPSTANVIGHVVAAPRDPPAVRAGRGLDAVRNAALWAYTAPEMGGLFASDATTMAVIMTGNKQYDNGAQNCYATMAAMCALARLSDDPAVRHEATLRAMRAGWTLHMKGVFHHGLAQYYKGMYWLGTWGPLGLLELAALTKDPVWLTRARRFADGLRATKLPSGTWTWFDEVDGVSGHSNERKNRDSDGRELPYPEHLLFLGKLRVEHGVTDYQDVERAACAWLSAKFAADPRALSIDRRPGEYLEAMTATMFGAYLVRYGEGDVLPDLKRIVAFVEANLTAETYPGAAAKPCVADYRTAIWDYHPRWGLGDAPGPSTAASTRMALVYRRLGDTAKATALVEAVLARQTPEGMIHHLGITTFGADHNLRIFGPNKAGFRDEHQCSFLRAETIVNLAEFFAKP